MGGLADLCDDNNEWVRGAMGMPLGDSGDLESTEGGTRKREVAQGMDIDKNLGAGPEFINNPQRSRPANAAVLFKVLAFVQVPVELEEQGIWVEGPEKMNPGSRSPFRSDL